VAFALLRWLTIARLALPASRAKKSTPILCAIFQQPGQMIDFAFYADDNALFREEAPRRGPYAFAIVDCFGQPIQHLLILNDPTPAFRTATLFHFGNTVQ
jgi:hypothetical protein